MTQVTKSIGFTLGSALGKGAAYAGHAAIRTAQGTGRFGQDVLSGTTAGYAEKSAQLAAARQQILESRQAPVSIKPRAKKLATA
ncbi:MAG: hypothetical protein JSS14_21980 [Proteobacteria bacterium]|nr:hypothetical protein [Pseudomonadota bacterium]